MFNNCTVYYIVAVVDRHHGSVHNFNINFYYGNLTLSLIHPSGSWGKEAYMDDMTTITSTVSCIIF